MEFVNFQKLKYDSLLEESKQKLINNVWTFEKYITSALAPGGYYHSFCYDGTYVYFVSSVFNYMYKYFSLLSFITSKRILKIERIWEKVSKFSY